MVTVSPKLRTAPSEASGCSRRSRDRGTLRVGSDLVTVLREIQGVCPTMYTEERSCLLKLTGR